MKKVISVISLVLVCVFLFSCCGKEEDVDMSLDISALAERLQNEMEYTYKMELIDKDIALSMYSVDAADVVSVLMYSAGGVSAEEIAVFETTSPEAAHRIKALAKQRIEAQIEAFTDYVPAEIPKLNNAVVSSKGVYVAVSVSPNYMKANDIIEDFFRQ